MKCFYLTQYLRHDIFVWHRQAYFTKIFFFYIYWQIWTVKPLSMLRAFLASQLINVFHSVLCFLRNNFFMSCEHSEIDPKDAAYWGALLSLYTHREIFSKSYQINLKSDCIYHAPIDLNPNGRPLGSKSIEKLYIQSDFGLIW